VDARKRVSSAHSSVAEPATADKMLVI